MINSQLKFISWNYDSQLELSLIDFLWENVDNTRLESCFNQTQDKFCARLIKLNGEAVFAGDLKIFPGQTLDIRELQIYREALLNPEIKSRIEFAWEKQLNSAKVIDAKSIVAESKILVVVGYSFPYYNRMIDAEILSSFNGVKIYIQDLPERFEAIQQTLFTIINARHPQRISLNQIELVKDLQQFYIPQEYLN